MGVLRLIGGTRLALLRGWSFGSCLTSERSLVCVGCLSCGDRHTFNALWVAATCCGAEATPHYTRVAKQQRAPKQLQPKLQRQRARNATPSAIATQPAIQPRVHPGQNSSAPRTKNAVTVPRRKNAGLVAGTGCLLTISGQAFAAGPTYHS